MAILKDRHWLVGTCRTIKYDGTLSTSKDIKFKRDFSLVPSPNQLIMTF
jgi:hypothetical protein